MHYAAWGVPLSETTAPGAYRQAGSTRCKDVSPSLIFVSHRQQHQQLTGALAAGAACAVRQDSLYGELLRAVAGS
jgi:hypothetical protein